MSTRSFLWMVAMSIFGGCSLGYAQEAAEGGRPNLLTNGTFEKGLDGWHVQAYHKVGTGVIDEDEKRDGKPTLRIDSAKGDDTMVFQTVKVKAQTRYRLTGYVKTKNVTPDNKKSKTGACLSIRGGYQYTEMVQKTKPWAKVSLDFDSGNRTELEIGPRLGYYSAETSGTAWYADLTLVELGKSRK